MAQHIKTATPPCPHCAAAHVLKNGHKAGRQRWRCPTCRHTFGPTFGTPLYQLHTAPAEVARSLLLLMRRGSFRAAEDVTGHAAETLAAWLARAADHAETLTQVLVHDLDLTEVEVDAFWSFVKKSAVTRTTSAVRRAGWVRAGAV